MARIGINGFGRIGRMLLRIAINKCKEKTATSASKVVMVNDPHIPPEGSSYLLKNDSFQGRCTNDIVEMGSTFMIDGQRVELSRESNVSKIPWSNCNVDYIIDTTGNSSSCDRASQFLTHGIKRVIVTGCSNVPMFIVGVNHCCFDLDMKTVSATTPSMNCLATMLRVLNENFQIENATSVVLQPLSNSDHILDDSVKTSLRNSRATICNFSPTESSAKRKPVDKIMPELEGKTESSAIRIPAPCVGAVILNVKFNKEAPLEVINCKFREASESYMKGTLKVTDEDIVSTDIIGDCYSCVIDTKASVSCSKCVSQIFAWYESEFAFAKRLYELAEYISSRENCTK